MFPVAALLSQMLLQREPRSQGGCGTASSALAGLQGTVLAAGVVSRNMLPLATTLSSADACCVASVSDRDIGFRPNAVLQQHLVKLP